MASTMGADVQAGAPITSFVFVLHMPQPHCTLELGMDQRKRHQFVSGGMRTLTTVHKCSIQVPPLGQTRIH